ncbi:MAG: copper chaperone PCu(A)C [Pseudomonadota bacterium]
MRRVVFIVALSSVLGAALLAFVLTPPGLLIQNVVAMPVPNAPNSLMVTLKIENPGGPDRLLDVSSEAAKVSVLKAPDVAGVPIPGNSTPSLSMEAGHIMLMGLEDAPGEGTLVPLVLEFEQAGKVAAKALVKTGTMAHGSGYDISAAETPPSASISVTQDKEGWLVRITTENFAFSKDLVDKPHQPETGHGHLYVQGIKIGRIYSDQTRIGALPKGAHTVRLTLNTNDHRAYRVNGKPIEALARIEVQ